MEGDGPSKRCPRDFHIDVIRLSESNRPTIKFSWYHLLVFGAFTDTNVHEISELEPHSDSAPGHHQFQALTLLCLNRRFHSVRTVSVAAMPGKGRGLGHAERHRSLAGHLH